MCKSPLGWIRDRSAPKPLGQWDEADIQAARPQKNRYRVRRAIESHIVEDPIELIRAFGLANQPQTHLTPEQIRFAFWRIQFIIWSFSTLQKSSSRRLT